MERRTFIQRLFEASNPWGLHHAGIIDISNNLPLVIEAVDTEEAIKAVVLKLEPMVGDGLVTLEEITVVGFKSKS